MYRSAFLVFILLIGSVSTFAKSVESAPASYLLQLSSNLACESLDIALNSKTKNKRYTLTYTTSAFAAVDVPAGEYVFGDVTCTIDNEKRIFDILKDRVTPITLSAGQAYYGGRLIFKKVEAVDINDAPEVLNNCTREFSRAREDTGNDCRDGVGVDTEAQTAKLINLYIPEVTDEDLKKIRNALSMKKEQLLYLPLNG